MAANGSQDNAQALAARVNALEAVIDGLLSTLLLHGILNRAEVDALISRCEGVLRERNEHAAAFEQLAALRKDIPAHIRAAQGATEPSHDDDH